jgi:hypothetical protein
MMDDDDEDDKREKVDTGSCMVYVLSDAKKGKKVGMDNSGDVLWVLRVSVNIAILLDLTYHNSTRRILTFTFHSPTLNPQPASTQ